MVVAKARSIARYTANPYSPRSVEPTSTAHCLAAERLLSGSEPLLAAGHDFESEGRPDT